MTRFLPEPAVFGRGLTGDTTTIDRLPFVWDSRLREQNRNLNRQASAVTNAKVVMELNPSQIEFQQSKRIARQDVRGGAVFYHGVNARGEDNDILVLSFSGSTGDIHDAPFRDSTSPSVPDPGANVPAEIARENAWTDAVYARYVEFWKLVQMSREPVILDDNTRNELRVSVVGLSFKQVVTFFGFFSQPVTWTETAQTKGSLDWKCEFTVNRVSPSFEDYLKIWAGELTTQDGSTREAFRTSENGRVQRARETAERSGSVLPTRDPGIPDPVSI